MINPSNIKVVTNETVKGTKVHKGLKFDNE